MTKNEIWDFINELRTSYMNSWTYGCMTDKEKNAWLTIFDKIHCRENFDKFSKHTINIIFNSAYSAFLYGIGYRDGELNWRGD